MTTRSEARRAVLEGEVFVNGGLATRPGASVESGAEIERKRDTPPFVGRGGDKLAPVLDILQIDVVGARVLDVGASTGGFTDLLLRRGAREVVALDVGTGQLHPDLIADPRVVQLDQVDIRQVPELGQFDLVVVDLSFISLCVVAPHLAVVAGGCSILALVKPQFELGRHAIGKSGVISDETGRQRAVERVVDCFANAGLTVNQIVPAARTGRRGNQEFFVWMPSA